MSNWKVLTKLNLSLFEGLGLSRFQIPDVLVLDDRTWRLFFTVRDNGSANIVTADIDPTNKMFLKNHTPKGLVGQGLRSDFDGRSVFSGCWLRKSNMIFYYYTGVEDMPNPPYFRAQIGCFLYHVDSNQFEKIYSKPVIETDYLDPLALMTPCITKINDEYLMWYSTSQKWYNITDRIFEHTYFVRKAVSIDGFNWKKSLEPTISFTNDAEGGIARPWVLASKGKLEMWYSYRKRYVENQNEDRSYRLGYATSADGDGWIRKDTDFQITPSLDSAWDNKMRCYPQVIESNGNQFMFYSGNGFGDGGIGVAIREA